MPLDVLILFMNSATDMLYKYNLQILGEIRKDGPIGHVLHNQRHFFHESTNASLELICGF